jgi:hypothetical protein
MESVWLLRGGGRDLGPVDPFGFSWPLAVSVRRPLIAKVGFPWISLDSLVRIDTFQWVTRLEAGKLFSQPFSWRSKRPVRGHVVEAMRKRRFVHGGS